MLAVVILGAALERFDLLLIRTALLEFGDDLLQICYSKDGISRSPMASVVS